MTGKRLFKLITSYFFRGILLTVPIAITVYVIYQVFVFLDSIIPLDIPGLGILSLVVGLTLIGLVGSSIILTPIKNQWKAFLDRVPLLKTIYTSIADLVTAFVGQKKKFTKPVLVKLQTHGEMEKLGFITEEDLSKFGVKDEKVAVYLPHSYAFSGNLFIVPAANVTPVDAKAADVMKFIVSGGVTQVSSE